MAHHRQDGGVAYRRPKAASEISATLNLWAGADMVKCVVRSGLREGGKSGSGEMKAAGQRGFSMLSADCPAIFLPLQGSKAPHTAVLIRPKADPFMHDNTSISYRRTLLMPAMSTLLAFLRRHQFLFNCNHVLVLPENLRI